MFQIYQNYAQVNKKDNCYPKKDYWIIIFVHIIALEIIYLNDGTLKNSKEKFVVLLLKGFNII